MILIFLAILSTAQSVYLEFLERTSSSLTLRGCDDCVSPAIILGSNPVPFGDLYHSVAHVSHHYILISVSGENFCQFCHLLSCSHW